MHNVTTCKRIDQGCFAMASSITAEIEMLPFEDDTSSVWAHFGFPSTNGKIMQVRKNRKQVYCRLCPKVLKYSGNTTNLRFHLQSTHSPVHKALVRPENEVKDDPLLWWKVNTHRYPVSPESI